MRLIFRLLPVVLSIVVLIGLAAPVPITAQIVQLQTVTAQRIDLAGAENESPAVLSLQAVNPEKGNPKLDSSLNAIVNNPASPLAAEVQAPGSLAAEPTVRVIVESIPGSENEAYQAAFKLGTVEAEDGQLLQMTLPVSRLSELAANQSIRGVRLPYRPLKTAVVSEGVSLINASAWQNAGYSGSGVKIGILDVGFAGYETLQSQGELPDNITTWWSPIADGPGSESHGAACAEIVYDIAPAANFYFANFDTEVEFGNAVDWLISQDVDIISSSIIWPGSGLGDGTGPINQMVDRAYNAGILWSQAAGNQAQMHWSGPWINNNDNDFLEFRTSPVLDEGNAVYVSTGNSIVAILNWNDVWGASSNDYDLCLFDKNQNMVDWSSEVQDGSGDPYESIDYTATYTGYYYLAIARFGNPAARTFNLYTYYQNLHYQVAANSLCTPADSTHVMTVGAVPWNYPTTNETFSSQGPNASGVIKPDLVFPDGVSTSSYGASDFYGTSACAPGAAGAAALVKGIHAAYSAGQLQAYLESQALHLGTAGKNNIFGSGRILLDNLPVKIAFTSASKNLTAGIASTLITLQTQDSAGNPLNVAGNTIISLTSSSTGGRFDSSAGGAFSGTLTSVTIAAGSNSAAIYYKDTLSGSPTITASGPGLTAATQTETIMASAATQVRIETAVSGSSTPILNLHVPTGHSVTGYAIARDQYGNFISNVNGTWSLTNKTGGVANSDLVPSGDNKSVIFSSHLSGTATIHVTSGSLISIDSGLITAIAGDTNGDGLINMADVTKTERIILTMDPTTPGADANLDGQTNMGDVTKIERIILGLD